MLNLSAKLYEAILKMKIKKYMDQHENYKAYDFIFLIIDQLPKKISFSRKSKIYNYIC